MTFFGEHVMRTEIAFWEAVILSGKKYEPQTKEEEAAYDIAEYLLSRKRKIAA